METNAETPPRTQTTPACCAPNSSRPPLDIVLVAINAQWVHTAAAVRILRNISRDAGYSKSDCLEFNLSDPVWKMAATVAERAPILVGISVYLWNREMAFSLARRLRAILPDVILVAGGPELSYGDHCPAEFDVVVAGEGDLAWREILREAFEGECGKSLRGVRRLVRAPLPIEPVSVYRECDVPGVSGKLVYLEASRGCPFRCAFCLSGRQDCPPRPWLAGGWEGLFRTIEMLRAAGTRTIKFLDRTFNARPAEALAVFRRLAAVEGTEFHFEICAELLDTATMDFLAEVPPHRFRFEIGVQSLNPATLQLIGRHANTEILLARIRQLAELGNIHLHVDLIWGLPGEDYSSLREGFNTLFTLIPDEVQLGFLKLLPGAPLEAVAANHGYVFMSEPPYEVLCHKNLSGKELLHLKCVEQVFNQLWNSGRFRRTVRFLMASRGMAGFDLFSLLAQEWQKRGLLLLALSVERLCEILLDIFSEDTLIVDYLRLDYALTTAGFTLPKCLSAGVEIPKNVRDALLKRTRASLVIQFARSLDVGSLTFGEASGMGQIFALLRVSGEGISRLVAIDEDGSAASFSGKSGG